MTWGEELNKNHALYRLEREWEELCKSMFVEFGPDTNRKIPKFVHKYCKLLFEERQELRSVMMRGDMPWFMAWFMRLDQIEQALVHIGFDSEKRAPVDRTRWFLQRLSLLAKHRLEKLGGTWPPQPIDELLQPQKS